LELLPQSGPFFTQMLRGADLRGRFRKVTFVERGRRAERTSPHASEGCDEKTENADLDETEAPGEGVGLVHDDHLASKTRHGDVIENSVTLDLRPSCFPSVVRY
jgi:hypothetical protein